MLLQFTVGNHLSFRDKTTLSLVAAPGGDADGRVIKLGDRRVLRTAAVYGANASGKSNLIKALRKAQRLVLAGTRPASPIAVQPFRLDPELKTAPSSFEFELLLGDAQYSFGFVAGREAIEEEWLLRCGVDETPLYTREGQSIHVDGLSTDPARREFLRFVADGTRPNQLFLSEASARNVKELGPVNRWFRSGLAFVDPGLELQARLVQDLEDDPAMVSFLSTFLEKADTGVSTLKVRPIPDDSSRQVTLFGTPRRVPGFGRGWLAERHLILLHAGDRAASEFALTEESDGTRRLLKLGPFLYALRRASKGRLIVLDELDRSLHTLLSRHFVKAFAAAAEGNRSQLVFTTHDTNLLDLDLMRPDSIWFAEKDRGGASHLYSLAEFKPEQLAGLPGTLETGYLQGRFGAIPFLGDPQRLGWTAAGRSDKP